MFRGFLCFLVGHQYKTERVLSRDARKVMCTRCGSRWAMYDPTKAFIPWDAEVEEFYAQGCILDVAHGRVPLNGKG